MAVKHLFPFLNRPLLSRPSAVAAAAVPIVAFAGLPLAASAGSAQASVGQASVGQASAGQASVVPLAASGSCPSAGGVKVPEAATPKGAEVTILGHGWGHGMGMSQYGAQGAAKLGCTYTQILTTYYRGSKVVTKAMTAPVRLSLDTKAKKATVLAEKSAFTWRTSAGATASQPKGSTWRVVPLTVGGKAGVAVQDADGTRRLWVATGSSIAAQHAGTAVRTRTYHTSSSPFSDRRLRQGTLTFSRSGSVVKVAETIKGDSANTAVQKYLWGLGEVPVSWPAHALRAQVVAARTYLAGRYDAANKRYSIGVTTSDQVYRGAASEDNDTKYGNRWKAAVSATPGKVLVDGAGALITTMYSSSMGGHTEDRAYVYGSQGGYGYLTAVDDSRWDAASSNPYRSWAKGYSRAAFAKALGLSSVTTVSLGARGSKTRDKGVVVVGTKSGRTVTKTYTGAAFRSLFGLRSPGFTIRLGIGGPGAQALVGDWDGDGRTDTGWYRNPLVSLRTATGRVIKYRFDVPGAKAVVADFDGNGKDAVSLFKNGTWYLRNGRATSAATKKLRFGKKGDKPLAGHWRKGRADAPGLVRGKTWILRASTKSSATRRFTWSGSGTPVVGDWNGDGVDGPGLRKGAVWTLGKNVPTSGTGKVKAPARWTTASYASPTGSVPSGMAKAGSASALTIVRGTRFIWRAAAGSSVTSLSNGG